MNKKVFGGLTIAGASLLVSCGADSGLGGEIEECTPEVASTTEVSDQQLAELFTDRQSVLDAGVVDASSNRGFNYQDYVDVQGEAVCRLEDGSLVFTVSGLALQQALSTEE